MAQLVEWSLPTPEVHGLNPVIDEQNIHIIIINCIKKTKIKKKEAENGQFFKKDATYQRRSLDLT